VIAPSTHAAPSTDHVEPNWQLAFAEHAVLNALEKANRSLLRQVGRSARHHSNGLKDLEPSRWHTVISTQGVDVDQLLEGALELFKQSAQHLDPDQAACIEFAIETYLRVVIAAGQDHNPQVLAQHIAAANCRSVAA
jgi:hypothetical protein